MLNRLRGLISHKAEKQEKYVNASLLISRSRRACVVKVAKCSFVRRKSSKKPERATSNSESKDEKQQNNSLNFHLYFCGEIGLLASVYRKPAFTGRYIIWNSFSSKRRKIRFAKTPVVICSETELNSELRA